MRKLAFSLALGAVILPASAFAAAYSTAGCGLGSLVFGDEPGLIQVLAATTNGTFASQTFGITTGTSNCVETADATASLDQQLYLQTNYANVMKDAAAGQGEYLSAFATILGCEAPVHSEFFKLAQESHVSLFTEAAASEQTLAQVKAHARQNEVLKGACTRI